MTPSVIALSTGRADPVALAGFRQYGLYSATGTPGKVASWR